MLTTIRVTPGTDDLEIAIAARINGEGGPRVRGLETGMAAMCMLFQTTTDYAATRMGLTAQGGRWVI